MIMIIIMIITVILCGPHPYPWLVCQWWRKATQAPPVTHHSFSWPFHYSDHHHHHHHHLMMIKPVLSCLTRMVNIISRPQRSLEGSPCIGWLLSSSSLSSSHIRFHCHGFKCHYHNRHCHCHHYHYFIRVMRKQTQTDFFLLQYIFVEIWREPLFTHIYVFHSFYKSRNF